jgi:formate hydrogenlyase subunit 3/multisubunit Na+/H+ antiporter MnhD subunit
MMVPMSGPEALLIVLAGAVAAFMACGLLAAVLHRRTLAFVYPLCLAAALVAAGVDLLAMLGGTDVKAGLPLGLPTVGLRFRLDGLSAFFGLVVNTGVVAASIYGLGLDRRSELSPRVEPFFAAFAAAMNLVLLADDAFGFLFAWELMSVTSWALVISSHTSAEARRAAHVYLVMASIGTVALLFAFGGMAGPAGGYAFDTIRSAHLDPLLAGLVLVTTIIGAGSKAGVVPLHVWLPLAHPAAPSHVSALMSGVMTKVAVYGFVRITFDLLGEPAQWWSMIVLVLGGASALLGVLYALMEHDLKRLLAFHTVENIGIIFIGLGLALAFQANHMQPFAALALTAALFHVFNHSLFKSLLFLGAGAVLHATGHRDMEKMGGLIHRMPMTAMAFLIGCVAISALPPLNGFVSEWLTFQAILRSPELPQLGLKVLIPSVGAVLALSAALAAACFVKAYGVSFLGRARSEAARHAHEANRFARASMFVLAGLCVFAGLFPGLVIDLLAPINLALLGDRMPVQASMPWLSVVPTLDGRSSYNSLLLFLFIVVSASLSGFAVHRLASRALRRAPAWDCGFPDPSPETQYTASSFAQPIRRVYGTVAFGATETVHMPPPGSTIPARFEVSLRDYIWDALYTAPARAVLALAGRLNVLQFLTIRRYLILMFVALITLLLVTAVSV